MGCEIFLTFVVPCYNVQEYLSRCLESLSRQKIDSGEGIEFVLVNDGSPDNCLELLNEFALKDNRAVVIDQSNQGVSAARNAGLRIAKGKYVFFLDGDDWLTDEASNSIYDACSSCMPDIVITNAFTVKEGEWDKKGKWNPCGSLYADIYKTELFVKSVKELPISFKAYKKDFLISNSIFFDNDLKVGEVYVFFLHALLYAEDVSFTDKYIMNYLYRKGSVMRDFSLKRDPLILTTISRIDLYGQQFPFDIRRLRSYNVTFYKIVAKFSFMKYSSSPYNDQLGIFVSQIVRNEIFKEVLRYFIFKKPGCNRFTFNCAILKFFPIYLALCFLRTEKKIFNFINTL